MGIMNVLMWLLRLCYTKCNRNDNDTKRDLPCFAKRPFPMFTMYQDLWLRTHTGRCIDVSSEQPPSGRRWGRGVRVWPGKCEMWGCWSDNQCQGFKPCHVISDVLFYTHTYMYSDMALRVNSFLGYLRINL